MTGRSIAHYQVLEKLGEGGMGVVYKARDTHLDRFVALKFLPEVTEERKARFVQEARAASALNHPNIVTIHEMGESQGRHYIAMEYVAGKTLDALIPRKGMRLGAALKIAVQVADALARAHAAGIIHRDLKPGNVMVDEHGLVKVLDFGLAKLTEGWGQATLSLRGQGGLSPSAAPVEEQPTRTLQPQTGEGAIVGTVAYMSPEQAQGLPVDARSDIFSFGSVLYEMATGRRAFQGDTKISTLAAVINKDPEPLSAEIPRDLERLISHCLRKDPARRFQHLDDVRTLLEELKEESDSGKLTPAPAAAVRAKRAWPLRIAGVAALLAAASLGIWLLRPKTEAPGAPLRAVPLTSTPGTERYPTLSPDGNQVAYSWGGEKGDNTDIYVKPVGPGTPLRLTTHPGGDVSPAWSPDGRWIAFMRGYRGKLQFILIPPLGGAERVLAEMETRRVLGGPYLAWTLDGKWLAGPYKEASEESYGLFLFSIESGEKRGLTAPPANVLGDTSPAISGDGRSLAFSREGSARANDLYVLRLSSALTAEGEPRRLTPDNPGIGGAAWTADGREIVYSSRGSLWRVAASGGAKPEPLAFAAENALHPVVSGPRRRLAYSWGFTDYNVWRLELAGPTQAASRAPLIASSRSDTRPQYSPDGTRIAFQSDRSGSQEIWTCHSDGSNCVQVTSRGAAGASSPGWSPDGKHIVFDSRASGQPDLYVVSAEGGQARQLTTHPASDTHGNWSRDGRWIYFASLRAGEYQVWKMPWGAGTAREGEAVQVTKGGGYVASESADGRLLYYSNRRNAPGLWRVPVGGGEETQVLPALYDPSEFAVTQQGIYFIPPRDAEGIRSIQFLELATGKIHPIARIDKPVHRALALSPDGRTLLYVQADQTGRDLMLVENFR